MVPAPKISASLLSADFGYLADAIGAAEEAGVDEFHFDVMDGHFVPNLTFGPPILEAVKRHATKPIDVHMMDRSPEHLIQPLAEAGGDIITVHVEGVADVDQTIDIILEAGAEPAVAIRPRTPVSALWSVADRIRRVLVMTVEPGLGGQDFLPDTLPKISEALTMMQTAHPDNRGRHRGRRRHQVPNHRLHLRRRRHYLHLRLRNLLEPRRHQKRRSTTP